MAESGLYLKNKKTGIVYPAERIRDYFIPAFAAWADNLSRDISDRSCIVEIDGETKRGRAGKDFVILKTQYEADIVYDGDDRFWFCSEDGEEICPISEIQQQK